MAISQPSKPPTSLTKTASPFLSLSSELRVKVYQFLFHGHVIHWVTESFGNTYEKHGDIKGILFTCSMVYHEARLVLFNSCSVKFLDSNAWERMLQLSPHSAALVRRARIECLCDKVNPNYFRTIFPTVEEISLKIWSPGAVVSGHSNPPSKEVFCSCSACPGAQDLVKNQFEYHSSHLECCGRNVLTFLKKYKSQNQAQGFKLKICMKWVVREDHRHPVDVDLRQAVSLAFLPDQCQYQVFLTSQRMVGSTRMNGFSTSPSTGKNITLNRNLLHFEVLIAGVRRSCSRERYRWHRALYRHG